MTTKEVKDLLYKADIFPDRFSVKNGVYTFKKSYYYTFGNSSHLIAEKIKVAIPIATIVDYTDDFKRWPGTSYFVVKFTV